MKKFITKAWAVVMFDGFIPDFNVQSKMDNVLQIHSTKKAAEKMVKSINKNCKGKLWFAKPCKIIY